MLQCSHLCASNLYLLGGCMAATVGSRSPAHGMQPGQLCSQPLYILWSHCFKRVVWFGFVGSGVVFKSLHWITQEKGICRCLPGFVVQHPRTWCIMPFWVDLRSELKMKQTTCLSKGLSSCPLLTLYFLLAFCVCVCISYCTHFLLVFLWLRGCFQRDTLRAGKLKHQRTSSRKIHLTRWQLVSIRENLIYLKTISLAISFRLNFAVLPGFNQREEEKATLLNLVREKLWSSQQGCLCKKNISLLVQIRLPGALLHFNENVKPCPRFSFAADGWGVWLHEKAHIFSTLFYFWLLYWVLYLNHL